MDILDKLKELEAYYAHTRGVGHTWAMMHGALNTDQSVIILAHDMAYANDLAGHCGGRAVPVSWHSLEHRLRGHRKPLLIDDSAMWWLLQDAIKEIQSSRQKLELDAAIITTQLQDICKLETEKAILRQRPRQTWDYRLRALWQVIRGRLNI